MHELSIAMSIVEFSEEEAARRGGLRVAAVHLRVGALSGIVKEALISSFEIAREDTLLESSHLEIEVVPGLIFCPTCDSHRAVQAPEWFRCPQCGEVVSDLVQGKELELVSLEIEA